MNRLYEMKISDARWWAYDIPGNVGWIIYIICAVKLLMRGFGAFSAIALAPAILMLIGVAELISERIAKLARVLPRIRLLRGFGALTLGGIVGAAISAAGTLARIGGGLSPWMLVGSILCAVFAGLCYKGYQAI